MNLFARSVGFDADERDGILRDTDNSIKLDFLTDCASFLLSFHDGGLDQGQRLFWEAVGEAKMRTSYWRRNMELI